MTGLGKLDKKTLIKQAGEGSIENNMKQLITDEAYSQISSKFPKLIPFIVGINIIEIIDNETAIGAAVLNIESEKLMIPVVYTNGNVDATSFVYNDDTDIILALTKKVASVLTVGSSSLSGSPASQKDTQSFDIGDIHKLFVPPKTYSPKVASATGSILFAVAEQSDLVKTALANKLSSDKEYRQVFTEIYGKEAVEFIENSALEKSASEKDNTPPDVKFSYDEIMDSDWLHKSAAMQEYALHGFAISHGSDYPKYSLVKTASIATRLKAITGDQTISTIDGMRPGVYTVYALNSLKPTEVVIADDLASGKSTIPHVIYGPNSIFGTDGVIDGNGVIGKQVNLSDSSAFDSFSKLKSYIEANKRTRLVFVKGGEIYGFLGIFLEPENISESLSKTVISNPFGSRIKSVVIEKGSDATPVVVGSTLYTGDKNVLIAKETPREIKNTAVVRTSNIGEPETNRRLVKVAYDGIEYIYKQAAYSQQTLVNELLKEGYDKASVYALVKTAKDSGSAEFAAINAKLDMLGNIVMNLAGKVESISGGQQQVQSDQNANGLSNVEQPVQEQEQAISPQEQEQQLSMPDDASGMPTEEQDAAMQAQQQQDVSADQQLLMQQQQQQPDVSGMNTSIDPEILKTLSELKDSSVMDVGVIAAIASNTDIADVVSQYKGDILYGASAIGRILLNALVKRNSVIEQIGEPKYKQTVNSLRAVFQKISDLYVDITRMQFESDGQMEG